MSNLEIFLKTCSAQWNEEIKKELPKYFMRIEEDILYIKTSAGTYRSLYSIVMEGASSPLQEKLLKYINTECPYSITMFIADQLLHERATHCLRLRAAAI